MLEKVDLETEICRFDSVSESAVYLGDIANLVNVSDKVKWHKEFCDGLGMDIETATLGEIKEQLSWGEIITVVINSPQDGEIYQWGNYPGENWFRKIGELAGYA